MDRQLSFDFVFGFDSGWNNEEWNMKMKSICKDKKGKSCRWTDFKDNRPNSKGTVLKMVENWNLSLDREKLLIISRARPISMAIFHVCRNKIDSGQIYQSDSLEPCIDEIYYICERLIGALFSFIS